MDEHYASRKRFRASYFSPTGQGSSSSNHFSFPALPTPESQSDAHPSPVASPTRSTQSSALKNSTVAGTTPSNGKRKAMDFVDLTGESGDSGATAPLSQPFKVEDVIDLTEDSETPASFPKAPVNPKELSYRATKTHPQHQPYPMQYPYPQQYSTVQDHPSPYQLYSNSSLGSHSQSYSNTQQYQNSQQTSYPQYYAYTQQGQLPQASSSYPGVSVPPGFQATYGPWATGISNGKDQLDHQPGAPLDSERSAYTYGYMDGSIDPRQSMSRGGNINTAYARQAQDQISRDSYSGAAILPNSVSGAQEQAGSELDKLDPHAARALLRSWAGNSRKVPCAGCSKPMLYVEGHVNMLFKRWLESPTMNISSVVSCQKDGCSANTCLGCGKRYSTTGPEIPSQIKEPSQLYWCCDAGRMVLLWILLCGVDRRKMARRRRGEYFMRNSKGSNISGAGVGYGSHTHGSETAQAVNFGMYGQLNNSRVSIAQPVNAAPTKEQVEDEFTFKAMACLDILLPSLTPENASSFDSNPPAPLLPVLTQSSILGTIAALLRNDSVEDATRRIRLYNNTLNVVDKLSKHPATANLTVNQARQEDVNPSDILNLSWNWNNLSKPDTDKYEETDSLASCIHNLDKASKSILARAQAHPNDFVGRDSDEMLSLCKRVSQTADFILAAKAKRSPSLDAQPAAATHIMNNDWQSELAVLELPDDVIMTRHTHASEAQSASNLAGGRMRSLSIQLSNLTTSVPPGVFVRYCSSRLDVMKVLIIGPKGTPYENGLFEFDLFCPAQFPNVPPKMKFRTTGGGRVRFNPNLYNDGKGTHITISSSSPQTFRNC